MKTTTSKADKTIHDFGEQWKHYSGNEGYYGSKELLADIVEPFLQPEDFAGKRVAEIGAGTGRIVGMMLECAAEYALAIEPSEGIHAARRNLANYGERVAFLHARGEDIPPEAGLDIILSVGVLQFVPEPKPIVDASFKALKPGGVMFAWLSAKEGNELYLRVASTLRSFTRWLPHWALAIFVRLLDVPLVIYIHVCRTVGGSWPLRDYLVNVLAKFSGEKRRLVIYDQLNPTLTIYHTRQEALAILEDSGFVDVRVHHRHGYSWSVVGRKPQR